MTGTGEGFHHNSPQKPIPEQPLESEELFSAPSPLGSLEALRKSQAEKNIPSGPSDSHDDSSGSVFDDDDDEPGRLLGDLPDAIPNISDGGTDILKSGRAELREFYERFSKVSPPEPSDDTSRPKDS